MVHLDELGVLDRNVAMTHCVHVDEHEIDVMAAAGRQRRALPDDRAQGQLRRHPDRQDPRDGAARHQRRHRHRRQQRVATTATSCGRRTWWPGCSRTPAWTRRCSRPRRRTRWPHSAGPARCSSRTRSARSSRASGPTSCCTTPTAPNGGRCSTSSTSWCGRPTAAACTPCFVDGPSVVEDYRCTTIDEDALWAHAQADGRGDHRPSAACPTRPSGPSW